MAEMVEVLPIVWVCPKLGFCRRVPWMPKWMAAVAVGGGGAVRSEQQWENRGVEKFPCGGDGCSAVFGQGFPVLLLAAVVLVASHRSSGQHRLASIYCCPVPAMHGVWCQPSGSLVRSTVAAAASQTPSIRGRLEAIARGEEVVGWLTCHEGRSGTAADKISDTTVPYYTEPPHLSPYLPSYCCPPLHRERDRESGNVRRMSWAARFWRQGPLHKFCYSSFSHPQYTIASKEEEENDNTGSSLGDTTSWPLAPLPRPDNEVGNNLKCWYNRSPLKQDSDED
uniref:Uncharacterized protein n=1 Tax=Oryza punctata TaxID=4537 RepID=A0A0E0KM01_ORYPU